MSQRAFFSWSGGKDSMLALHRALAAGASVEVLLAMFDAAFLADLPESVDALHEIRQREPAPAHHFVAELH